MNGRKMLEAQPYMGDDTSRIFSGETDNRTNVEMYGETADFFANEIRKRLPVKDGEYTIADVGSFQGELLADLLAKLPEYRFKAIAIDINEAALQNNTTTDNKVVAHAEALPLEDKSVDVAIIRYVLQWNNAEKQKKILSELARVVRSFALLEHVGSDVIDSDIWREKTEELFTGEKVSKMKRGEHFFSSKDEVERWMLEAGIDFQCIKNRKIDNGADVYIERYALTPGEAEQTRSILGDKNYFQQTDWAILPKKV